MSPYKSCNPMQDGAYLLRPHHGLCLAFFSGHGYSPAFTAHTNELLHLLLQGAYIRLFPHPDVICAACPNRKGDPCNNTYCIDEDKVRSLDHAVLKACSLKEDTKLSFSSFACLIQSEILSPGLRSSICGGCCWDSLCSQSESRFKK